MNAVPARPSAILVVDDETDFLTTYRRLLGRDGFRVVTASTRTAGLRALDDEPFAATIVDVRLPDGNGLDLVRKARLIADPPPSIVVTGYATKDLRRAALEAGAAEVVAKPFKSDALVARVRALASSRA
jgi:DNA-binding response OmpR family regulator